MLQLYGKIFTSIGFVVCWIAFIIYHDKKNEFGMLYAGINAIIFLILFEGFRF